MTLMEKLCGVMNNIECYNSIIAVTSTNAFWYSYIAVVSVTAFLLIMLGFVRISTSKGRKILFTRPAYWYVGWLIFVLFNILLYFAIINPLALKYL